MMVSGVKMSPTTVDSKLQRAYFSKRNSKKYLCFIFIIIAAHNSGDALRFPPKIVESTNDASRGTIDISKGSTLILTCEGDEPVTWKPVKNSNGRFEEEVDFDSTDSSIRNNKAILRLSNVVTSDSGIFTCYHRDAFDPYNAQDMTEIVVLVNDGDAPGAPLFQPAPQYQPIQIKSSSQSIIPCLPARSTVNVTLWKADVQPHQQFFVDGTTVTFDMTKGFLINFPSPIYSGSFYCLATLGSRSEKLNFLLLYLSDTTAVPTPNIETKGKFATENSDFVLTCSVRSTTDVFLYLDWKYPSLVEKNRVVLGENLSKDVTSKNANKYRVTSRNITIMNIERSDQGDFTCIATDHNSRASQKSVFVEVRDAGNAFISFSLGEGGDNEAIEQPLGSSQAKFVVFVKYFPTPPILTWYKGERQLTNSNKHRIISTDAAATLIIFDLGRRDTGEYILVGKMGDVVEDFTLTLLVTEPPEVSIQEMSGGIFQAGKNFTMICHVEGCPQSNITWEWSPCRTVEDCPKRFREMTGTGVNNEQVTEFGEFQDGCHVQSILSGTALGAGYYRCVANSHLGVNSTEAPFFITDFPTAMGVNSTASHPYAGDDLRLSCYASAFYYSRIQWMWIPRSHRTSVLVTNMTNVLVLPGATRFSYTAEIQISHVALHQSGQYLCQAKQRVNDQWSPLSVNISVIETVAPKVVQTNLNSSKYVLFKEDNFEFECVVVGVPPPNISWFRNKTRILAFKEDGATQILNQGTKLYISRVLPSDSGEYSCQAVNRAGILILNATLEIKDVARNAKLSRGVIIAIVISALVCLIVISTLSFFYGKRLLRERKEKKELRLLQHMLFDKGDLGSYNPDLPLDEQVDTLPYDKRWEFPREKLKLGRTIGQGAFGRVVKADAQGITDGQESTPVAVKMLKERADLEQRKALMQELKIMIHLGKHVNVVNLLGAVTKDLHKGEFLVIVEYCRFGNLRHFLLRNREHYVDQIDPLTGQLNRSIGGNHYLKLGAINRKGSARFSEQFPVGTSSVGSDNTGSSETRADNSSRNTHVDSVGSVENYRISAKPNSGWTVSTTALISYAFQVACGMEYLSSKKLVHRDLALRNILLAEGDVVKICDFGLAKDCYKKAYYRKKGQGPLPIKWMAIESIRDRVFSTESDVWSFGIILWELFTLGGNPYPGLEVDEEFYRKLANGYRMEKPSSSTEALYGMMLDCWQHQPKRRPYFSDLKKTLTAMLDEDVVQYYLNMNDDFGKNVENPHYMNMLPSDGCDQDDQKLPYDGTISPDYQNEIMIGSDLDNRDTVHYLNMSSPAGEKKSPAPVYKHQGPKIDELLPMLREGSTSSPWPNNHGALEDSDDQHYLEPPVGPARLVNNYQLSSSPSNKDRNPFVPVNSNASVENMSNNGYLDMGIYGINQSAHDRLSPSDVVFRGTQSPNYQVPISPPPRYTQIMSPNNKF